eukprot:414669-Pyramimonas_sp.AAC.1
MASLACVEPLTGSELRLGTQVARADHLRAHKLRKMRETIVDDQGVPLMWAFLTVARLRAGWYPLAANTVV